MTLHHKIDYTVTKNHTLNFVKGLNQINAQVFILNIACSYSIDNLAIE